MKRLIITSLVLAAMLLLVSGSFASWNEGGFKNSPLFKHALNEAITNMENQGNEAKVEGANLATTTSNCNVPNAPVTYSGCETTEETCQGMPTCQQYTCFGTCYEPTCVWATNCVNTCQNTCQTTCVNTSDCTCNMSCPPAVEGTVFHYYWGYRTNYWGAKSRDRIVKQLIYPYKQVGFDENTGYYFCDEWGQPTQQLLASGKILNTLLTDQRRKDHQDWGSLIQIDFECVRE